MKKSAIIILVMATVFASCKKTEKHEEVNKPIEAVQEQKEDILSTQWMNDIQLNKGTKWEANIETTQGVEKMQELLKTQATSSIEDYHHLANNLNGIKNNLVKECTMTGASHDNLHIWLYPLIGKITALSKTTNLDEASRINQGIKDNINAYSDYFE